MKCFEKAHKRSNSPASKFSNVSPCFSPLLKSPAQGQIRNIVGSTTVQTKLKVGSPDSASEREADYIVKTVENDYLDYTIAKLAKGLERHGVKVKILEDDKWKVKIPPFASQIMDSEKAYKRLQEFAIAMGYDLTSQEVPEGMPSEARSYLLQRRFKRQGITVKHIEREDRDICIWVSSSGRFYSYEVMLYFPKHINYYLKKLNLEKKGWTKRHIEMFHRVMSSWNNQMRDLIEKREMRPEQARAYIKRKTDEAFIKLLQSAGQIFGPGNIAGMAFELYATLYAIWKSD